MIELGKQDTPGFNVDMKRLVAEGTDILCSKCNGRFFQSVTFFRKVSAIVSPTGNDMVAPIDTYSCIDCGNINREFLPSWFGTATTPPPEPPSSIIL